MPPPISPNDWERLFRRNAPRRGGPLNALANLLLVGAVVALLGGGTFFALRFGFERVQQAAAQTAEQGQLVGTKMAATRAAATLATATASVALSAPTPTPAPDPVVGRSSVVAGGNVRSEPLIAPETIIGQICIGDQVDVLEERVVANGTWYRIRVTQAGESCTAQRVTVGSVGWASSTLLAPIAP